MSTIDDIEWNELQVIARHNGEITFWKAWKRNIGAFNDPGMWEGPGKLDTYFERLEGERWGPAGYGFIVVDYDAKQTLSINDYSHPGSFMLIPDNVVWETQENPDIAPMKAMAARPDQWQHANVRAMKVGQAIVPGDYPKVEEISLDQIVPAGADETTFLSAITTKGGMLDLGARGTFMSTGGSYAPLGWTQQDDRGKDMPEWLLEQLEALRERGFPAPDWTLFDADLESSDIPLTEEALNIFIEEEYDGDESSMDEYGQEVVRSTRRYLALKSSWPEKPASARIKGP